MPFRGGAIRKDTSYSENCSGSRSPAPRRIRTAGTAFLAFVVRLAFSSGRKCSCRFGGRYSDRFSHVDYKRIVNEVHQADRAWLAVELNKRDEEIQRLRGELAYYENFQRTVMRETLENGSAIQLLAQRTISRR